MSERCSGCQSESSGLPFYVNEGDFYNCPVCGQDFMVVVFVDYARGEQWLGWERLDIDSTT